MWASLADKPHEQQKCAKISPPTNPFFMIIDIVYWKVRAMAKSTVLYFSMNYLIVKHDSDYFINMTITRCTVNRHPPPIPHSVMDGSSSIVIRDHMSPLFHAFTCRDDRTDVPINRPNNRMLAIYVVRHQCRALSTNQNRHEIGKLPNGSIDKNAQLSE